MDLAFPPGVPRATSGPLARFLPPIEEEAVLRFLDGHRLPARWVLDPFGASPTLAIEAARAHGAVAAVSNPVVRFVLEHRLRPIQHGELRSALATLASAPKDGSRLERFLLDLYRTECSRCGAGTSADQFVWDREAQAPVVKSYVCGVCHHAAEEPTSDDDRVRALSSPGYALARAWAVERAAPADDPDREHVEDALGVYPARAIYALVVVLQKVDQLALPPPLRRAAEALLLSACDAANGLWGYPETRVRPKQLTASPRFREVNVWRALERALDEWAVEPTVVEPAVWPESGPPAPGVLAVFAGPIRELDDTLPRETPAIVTALPRPNQAFWTLSALWASWLWGREAAAPIRMVLRRRRYDWTWHAAALRGAFLALARRQTAGAPVVGFLPEAEPGFLAAALAGLDAAGYRLRGHALRLNEGQGVLVWEAASHRPRDDDPLPPMMEQAAERVLRDYGEPGSYALLHAAAVLELARRRRLAELWEADDPPLTRLTDEMERILAPGGRFERLEPRVEPESGHYWLVDPVPAAAPHADRVERIVLEALSPTSESSLLEVEARCCDALRGLHTPDRRLIHACLASYATQSESGGWRLRPEDEPETRHRDLEDVRRLIRGLGARFGYQVADGEDIVWREGGRTAYRFHVQGTAALARALALPLQDVPVIVVPGGRALLIAEKERRDPRLRAWQEAGGRIVKFRHIRRLAGDPALTPVDFAARLGIDPPGHEDPQLPLL